MKIITKSKIYNLGEVKGLDLDYYKANISSYDEIFGYWEGGEWLNDNLYGQDLAEQVQAYVNIVNISEDEVTSRLIVIDSTDGYSIVRCGSTNQAKQIVNNFENDGVIPKTITG